jgi:hypothetical protein
MFKVVTPQIQSKMLAHNAIDLATTWNFHFDMMRFPDYRGFVEETLAMGGLRDGFAPITPEEKKKQEDVEAFL